MHKPIRRRRTTKERERRTKTVRRNATKRESSRLNKSGTKLWFGELGEKHSALRKSWGRKEQLIKRWSTTTIPSVLTNGKPLKLQHMSAKTTIKDAVTATNTVTKIVKKAVTPRRPLRTIAEVPLGGETREMAVIVSTKKMHNRLRTSSK
jgi:hypothetical protein